MESDSDSDSYSDMPDLVDNLDVDDGLHLDLQKDLALEFQNIDKLYHSQILSVNECFRFRDCDWRRHCEEHPNREQRRLPYSISHTFSAIDKLFNDALDERFRRFRLILHIKLRIPTIN